MKNINWKDALFGAALALGIVHTIRQWRRDSEEEPIRQARIRAQLAELAASRGSR